MAKTTKKKALPKAIADGLPEDTGKADVIRYRKYPQTLHFDSRYLALSPTKPSGRTLYNHLITGSHTSSIPGIAFIGRAAMAEELHWELSDFDAAFAEIEAQGLVVADWVSRVVFMPDVITYDWPQSTNVVKGWTGLWRRMPDCEPKLMAYLAIEASLSESEAFLNAFRMACAKPFCEPFPKPSSKPFPKPSAEASRIQGAGNREQGTGDLKDPSQGKETSQFGGGTTSHAGAHTRGRAGTDDRGRPDDWEALQ